MTIEQKKPVGKFLLTHEVENLISNYKQQRWAGNSEKIGRTDTLNIWWTIDELENFLAVAKENQADGVKFCFGVYDTEKGKAGQQTIAMVATQEVETESGVAHKNVYKQTPYGKNIVAYNGIPQQAPTRSHILVEHLRIEGLHHNALIDHVFKKYGLSHRKVTNGAAILCFFKQNNK